MKKLLIIAIFPCLFFLTGCFGGEDGLISDAQRDRAITSCQNQCEAEKRYGDLADGPCLSNEIQPDWVCDIAHSPRQTIDEYSENQCSAYRSGEANHFVELDTNCRLIRAE